MNRTDIIKAFYEVIKDSAEWSGVCEGKEYAQFVDGAAAMVEKMTDMYCNMPWEDEDLRACYPEAGTTSVPSCATYTDGEIASHVSEIGCLADK